ncbi:MAPEG family [Teratosphaeria destructans]|uniref:MAPEG family n=1 Tax=Teratosphaeria destructans TaxID=418781 RepID=A0A9W7ST26_9PEZI|nr:MAPEG family [Teratosphaeria destructans]
MPSSPTPLSILVGSQPLLKPVISLASWTLVMEAWMYAHRIPAISKYNVDTSPESTKEDMNARIPRRLQWPADNYNHLMEQPTQFYAVALALNALGRNDQTTVVLAWTYVGLRIVHSVVQSVANPVGIRFLIFASSSLTLLGLTGKAAMALLQL